MRTLKILRQLQYEVSQLNRKVNSFEEESKQWSLRYSRRLCISSNFSLGIWIFLSKFSESLKNRYKLTGILAKIALPASLKKSNILLVYIISAVIVGVRSCAIFFASTILFTRSKNVSRNLGFILSTGYSAYLASIKKFSPWANYSNIFLNVAFAFARYYHLHGLPAFNHLQFL